MGLNPISVSALDPAFTQQGDRCCQVFGKLGRTMEGITVLQFCGYKLLREDVRTKEPRNFQIAKIFIANCRDAGVEAKNAAMDATGGGDVLADIIAEEWGTNEVLRVVSSAACSDIIFSPNDKLTCKQKFDRKVSELWGIGREFLRYKQFRGFTPELMREMKARKFDQVKGVDGLKTRVETKPDMKQRLGFSPDIADAFFVMLELCRKRLNFAPGDQKRGISALKHNFLAQIQKAEQIYYRLYE